MGLKESTGKVQTTDAEEKQEGQETGRVARHQSSCQRQRHPSTGSQWEKSSVHRAAGGAGGGEPGRGPRVRAAEEQTGEGRVVVAAGDRPLTS